MNLKTLRESLSHIQKKFKKINLRNESACAKAQLRNAQTEKPKGGQMTLKLLMIAQRQQKTQQRYLSSLLSYLSTSLDKLHLSQKCLKESEQAKVTPRIEKYEGKTWRQYYTFIGN